MNDARLKLAVLISGGGTTFRNFLQKKAAGELDVDFALVISSNPQAGGLKFAAEAGIPTRVVQPRDFATAEEFRDAVFGGCREAGVDYVVMAGFLKHVLIPPDFENRVVNIHPALIPSFCGKGFYGLRVHQAVLDYGAKVSGCTIHFVDQVYDHGPIILQKVVPVQNGDTAEVLAARVFEAECEAYPEAIRLLAAGRVRVVGRRVEILPAADQ
jgi:phosphoribosylglycinamide formyltransferase-1